MQSAVRIMVMLWVRCRWALVGDDGMCEPAVDVWHVRTDAVRGARQPRVRPRTGGRSPAAGEGRTSRDACPGPNRLPWRNFPVLLSIPEHLETRLNQAQGCGGVGTGPEFKNRTEQSITIVD